MDGAWKRAFDSGQYVGPRLFACGHFLTTTGGHFLTSGHALEVDGPYGWVSDAIAWKAHGDEHRALGGNIQIIGSPEHVVDQLVGLKRAGCDGVQLAFFDFAP